MPRQIFAALYLSSLAVGAALAAVTAEEAGRLGEDLTPLGGLKAGNADGSIPEWDPTSTPIPDGFKIHVYPTKRSYETPDWVYANAKKNAVNARLVADGQKIEGNLAGTPFPIPQSGLEVLWNHMIRYSEDYSQEYDVYYVSSDGKPILSTTASSSSVFPMYKNPDQLVGDTPWTKLRINYKAPARGGVRQVTAS